MYIRDNLRQQTMKDNLQTSGINFTQQDPNWLVDHKPKTSPEVWGNLQDELKVSNWILINNGVPKTRRRAADPARAPTSK